MEINTVAVIAIVAFILGFLVSRSTEKYSPDRIRYRQLDNTNQMGDFTFKKCLCNQQGSALYPAYDGLGTRVFREVSKWGPKNDQNYDDKYFAAVV